jgi:hypothetical protein
MPRENAPERPDSAPIFPRRSGMKKPGAMAGFAGMLGERS